MKWNAIHHDLHLAVLAGVGRVFAIVLAAAHATAHCVLHLRPRAWGGGCGKEKEVSLTDDGAWGAHPSDKVIAGSDRCSLNVFKMETLTAALSLYNHNNHANKNAVGPLSAVSGLVLHFFILRSEGWMWSEEPVLFWTPV